MKRLIYYAFLMIMVVVILPMLIVKGCSIQSYNTDNTDNTGNTGKSQIPKKQQTGIKIKVYIAAEDKVKEMYLEEYVKGVVAAEMPAEFGIEALKAQAVAARTYAVGRMKGIYKTNDGVHDNADVCTDFSHCQAWMSKQTAMKGWSIFNAYKNWNKIEKAVNETSNLVIVYESKIINPLFHSNSGGKTENSEDVWEGRKEPYLRSVSSSGEEEAKEFKSVVTFKISDFYNILKKEYPDFKINQKKVFESIKLIDYTEGERVKDIKIGNINVKGTKFRSLFSLRSANFKIEKKGKDSLEITVIGNGHGVGMSQWGANYLSKNGGSYEEILKYYYTGVELLRIENLN